jgi:endonuclease/exonuclease/phosphatase family metal-dependent hydrolase
MTRLNSILLLVFSLLIIAAMGVPYFHPETIPFLPFIGLLFPIWVFLTVVFTTFAYFKRNKLMYWGILVLIISSSYQLKIVGLTFFEFSTENPNSIKLLSYNLRLFGLYDDSTTTTRDNIFQFIRKENPDIAIFQEYYRQDKPTDFETYDSLSFIIKSKDYHERSAHNNNGHRNFGISIFSKYPMIARGDVIFENQGLDDFNFCIFADIVACEDTFRVYNVHLQSIRLSEPGNATEQGVLSFIRRGVRKMSDAYGKRADQARRVIEHMKSSPYPVILCGDFNDTPISYTYHQFNKYLTDAFLSTSWGLGSTYIGKIPAGRIDYFFHSENVECSKFQVHDVDFSDHRPISCQFNFVH